MKKHILAACSALALAGVTAAAQTPSPSQPTTSPSAQPAGGTITVEGCLKPATGSASTGAGAATGTTGTPGATGTSGAAAQYMLTDAETKGSGTAAATGTTGGTSAARGAVNEDEYLLRADSASVNLAQHVNHQVEIVGRLAPGAMGGAASPTTGTPGTPGAPTGTRSGSASGHPTLTVTSVKMIAANCKM